MSLALTRLGAAHLGLGVIVVMGLSSSGLAEDATLDTTPAHMVAFFPSNTCAPNWTALDEAQGRFLVAVSDSADVGTTVGTPLANLTTPPTHVHQFQTSVTLTSHGCLCTKGGAGYTGATPTTHDVPHNPPGTTGAAEAYSYVQVLACQKDAPTGTPPPDTYPQNAVAFFNAPSCPSNWEQMTSNGMKVNGVPVIPFWNADTSIGKVIGTPITPSQPWEHTHQFSSSIWFGNAMIEADKGSGGGLARGDQSYSFGGTTSKASIPTFPYLQLLLCKKTAFEQNTLPTGLPQGLLTFFAQSTCPNGWEVPPTGGGRPLLGLPDGGEPNQTVGENFVKNAGAAYVHTHAFSGMVDVGSQQIVEKGGCVKSLGLCQEHFASDKSLSFSGETAPNAGLPYLALNLCAPKG